MSILKRLAAATLTCLTLGNLASPALAHGRHHGSHPHHESVSRDLVIFGLGVGLGHAITPHYRHHDYHTPTPYPNDRRCSWGSGYRGCWHRKEALTEEQEIRIDPPKEEVSLPGVFETLEPIVSRGVVFCDNFYGCGAGVRMLDW